jgi:hypothetical protein
LTERPARVISRAHAPYPDMTRLAGFEGVVRLRVQVLASGAPGAIETLWPPHGINTPLDCEARLAAQLSRYEAAYSAGVPVDSEVEVAYEFTCEPHCGETPAVHAPDFAGARVSIFDVPEYHLCIAGHWISGPTEVRMNDARVYVGGIRVFPGAFDFNRTDLSVDANDSLFAVRLQAECRESLQEMTAGQYSFKEATDRLVSFLEGAPGVARVDESAYGRFEVTLITGRVFTIDVKRDSMRPDPCDQDEQRKAVVAERVYYEWVRNLMERRVRFECVGLSVACGEQNRDAKAMLDFLASGRVLPNASGGLDWPEDLGALGSLVESYLRKPTWVFRI